MCIPLICTEMNAWKFAVLKNDFFVLCKLSVDNKVLLLLLKKKKKKFHIRTIGPARQRSLEWSTWDLTDCWQPSLSRLGRGFVCPLHLMNLYGEKNHSTFYASIRILSIWRETLQDSTDNSSIDKVETSLDIEEKASNCCWGRQVWKRTRKLYSPM